MDGKELLYGLRQLLNEDSTSPFLDDKTSFRYLWMAATKFVERTNSLKAEQSITTVANQTEYELNSDFLKLFWSNRDERMFIRYNDGTSDQNIYWKDLALIAFDNETNAVSIPSWFSVRDESALDAQISGTTTAAGAATGGESTLTDTVETLSGLNPGDVVHNITDGSDGIVTSVTDSDNIKTALFNGTDNDWTSGDSYIIQPMGRMAIVLDPPPSTTGHTVTIGYIQQPAPVYTSFAAYRIPQRFLDAIIMYAAWLFKYRDDEPDTGDRWFTYWDDMVRDAGTQLNASLNRRRFSVNFKMGRTRHQSAR